MERFALPTGLLPEQIWDEPNRPEAHLYLGRPTGSAMPLMWAHAEFLKLLRSVYDGQLFDLIPEVTLRYLSNKRLCKPLEIWKPNRQIHAVKRGWTLRIQAPALFRLTWSRDDWETVENTPSVLTALGIAFVDIPIHLAQQAPIRFALFWTRKDRWEGRDREVVVREYGAALRGCSDSWASGPSSLTSLFAGTIILPLLVPFFKRRLSAHY